MRLCELSAGGMSNCFELQALLVSLATASCMPRLGHVSQPLTKNKTKQAINKGVVAPWLLLRSGRVSEAQLRPLPKQISSNEGLSLELTSTTDQRTAAVEACVHQRSGCKHNNRKALSCPASRGQ